MTSTIATPAGESALLPDPTPDILEDARQVPLRLQYAWGSGALGIAILMNSIGALILFYMVSVLQINPALAGTLIFVSKLLGVVTDPFVGTWSDRLQTRGSRRRPFLLWGAFACAGSYAMIFTTPMFASEALRAAYVFLALIVYTCGYALYNVPYMSMPAEMTDSYHERSAIHGVRMMFVAVATLVVGTISPLLLEALGRTSPFSYAVIGVCGGAIILGATMTAYLGTKSARFTISQVERPRILSEVGHVFANRHFIRLLGVKATQLIGVASSQAAGMFFLLNVLQRDLTILAPAAVVGTLVQLAGAPLLVKLSRRIGKSQTYIVGGSVYLLAVLSWFFASPAEPAVFYILRMALVSFGACANVIMAMSMLTDIITLDSRKTGVRREGVYTAFYSFTEKFTFAVGPLIVGIALSLAGFDKSLPPEAMHTPDIRQALLLGVCYLPGLLSVAAITLLAGYKLKPEDLA
ncbi:MFS transporter [Novosphingobium profundi]|uniref:MFS transporter n=1 Tax=Novosphingobium profundi TaxID=1774954 RepID=UPI001BDA67E0|nr:MFS transporter [Novosphingobium profundi]MBT0668215.1 MFS transporter [Novosphingobium profundi]